MLETFECRQLKCTGVTAAMCIKRQFATTGMSSINGVGARYEQCQGCVQGVKVLAANIDLKPDKRQPKINRLTCPVCDSAFTPYNKNQKCCDRRCSNIYIKMNTN